MGLFAESWNVAWRKRPELSILSDEQQVFSVIPNSLRYWAADPFLFEYAGNTYIFAELYDYVKRHGIIGYYKLGEKGERWHPIIEESYHLSYPCIFEAQGKIYIMPEANESGSLYLYECVRFPEQWKKQKVLKEDVKYVDTTFFNQSRGYALTYDIADVHNPKLVLLDVTGAGQDSEIDIDAIDCRRPAGKAYEVQRIRPAQNCREGYGKSLLFYQYELDESGWYQERQIASIQPEALKFDRKIFLDGMHTYNSTSQYEVIDIKTKRINLINLFFRTYGKIERIFGISGKK